MSFIHLWPRPIISKIKQVITRNTHELVSENKLKVYVSEKLQANKMVSKNFRTNYKMNKVCDITVDTMYGGLQDIPCLVCETTSVDEYKGIHLQGFSIPECYELLPKAKNGSQPLPEGLFWLLMTGDIPTVSQTEAISREWVNRAQVPPHVVTMINNFPTNLHPMSQLAAAISTFSYKSNLRQAYICGVHKMNYWEYVYEDSMDLIACLPAVAALIFTKYTEEIGCVGASLAKDIKGYEDWSGYISKLLGYNRSDFIDFLRLYICFCHDSDHGNTSMHAAHIVGSALSDPYLAFASSLNLLAGPLVSNEKSLLFLKHMQSFVGIDPSDKKINEFVMNFNAERRHSLPFQTDLRFNYFYEFVKNHLPEDPLLKLSTQLCRLGHNHLVTVDVLAGIFFEFYKVNANFHPVFMSLSHLIRVASSLVWDRASGYPIEHPISMSTNCLIKACNHHDMPGHTGML